MKQIDLSEWVLFSQRPYSKSYKSADGKWMLKTVCADDNEAFAQLKLEHDTALAANNAGAPTPKVGDLVSLEGGSVGLIFEYVKNKKSFSRAISENPENTEEYMRRFANVVRAFHEREADVSAFTPFEDKVRAGLAATPLFTQPEKDYLLNELEKMPRKTKCLHGDMQLSNAIMSDQGDYLIDLSMMSYGHPYYDIGFFYHMSHFCNDELANSLFHVNHATLLRCWELYARFYFDTNDLQAVEELIKPYARFGPLVVLPIVPTAETVAAGKEFILSKM